MTIDELLSACKTAIETPEGAGKIVLTIPGPEPRGARIRLDRATRKKCPMGEILCVGHEGTVAMFDAVDVLAWLAAQGAVKVRAVVREETPNDD